MKLLKRALPISFVAAVVVTVFMVLIPRLNNPEEFVNAPSLIQHLLISFVAVFGISVPVSALFYWLRDSIRP